MPGLASLIIFVHVVDAKVSRKAARRLKMPTSAVSRRKPERLQSGRLVEVMLKSRFQIFHLSLCHLGNRFVPSSAW